MDKQKKPAMGGQSVSQQDHSDPAPPAPSQVAEPKSSSTQQAATAQQVEEVEGKMSAFERATLRWAKAAVIMSGLAAIFVCLQWWEMHSGSNDTHNLAVAAANQATWTQRLATNTDIESGHMKDLADRMKDEADRTKDEADQTRELADQAKVQANAAKSAAETAKESLRISERAYLISGFPTLNVGAEIASMPIINIGHVPSGKATIVMHEATIKVSDPNASIPERVIPLEAHWKHADIDAVPPTAGTITFNEGVALPSLDANLMNDGHQQVFIVGTISYNDGFPETSAESWNFCEAAAFNTKTKQIEWKPCDWTLYIRQVINFDHYPQDEYQR